ncbi:MAG: lamin tail domain-containing protein, partial [Hymenobacter sp.]
FVRRSLPSLLALVLLPLLGWGQIVISQVYGGGGNSGATYSNDFVELFNPTTSPVTITGWTLQYASAAGAFSGTSTSNTIVLSGTIAPGRYFLLQGAQQNAGTGTAFPVLADQAAMGTNFNLAGTAGKVALAKDNTTVTGPTASNVSDFVGYGVTATQAEGSANTSGAAPTAAPAPSNTTSILRANNGCTDTNVNNADFTVSVSGTSGFAPRSSSTAANSCATTTPALTVSSTNLGQFGTRTNSPGATQADANKTYALTGSNLTTDVTVTAPTGYEVSLTGNATSYGSTVTALASTVQATGGQTIYARLTAATAGTYGTSAAPVNITNVSGPASTNVAVYGLTVTPSISASPNSISPTYVVGNGPSSGTAYT